jgi:formyl-CoA transferase
MNTQILPLDGVKVIDFTQVMLGPCCTQLLGDFGAEVIKIERPGIGDLTRTSIPDRAGLDNPVFLALNRNKRSIGLNIRTPAGRDLVYDMVRTADVVVSNFRSGVMDRIGFGYEELRAINPRIIWASGTGFGPVGPYQHKGGQDVLAQAYSGVMERRPSDDHPVSIYPTALCDYSAGMHLVQGILFALLAREKTGEGQKVEVSLYDSILSMQMQEAAMQLARGAAINWARMPLAGAFPTSNGVVCMVGGFKQNPLQEICKALELPDLSLRPEFATPADQFEHRPELQRIFRERFATNTTEHWVTRLEEVDILCAPVRDLKTALEDEQTAVNGMIIGMEHPVEGPFRVLNAPVHLSATAARARYAPPTLAQHSEEIVKELGYDDDRIAALKREGVLA